VKKLIGFVFIAAALTVLTGCPQIKPFARTALEAARHACAVYAEQTGVSFKDVCETEEQLRPFIDSILAAQQAAAAQAAGAAGACPECPECEKAPEAAPEAKPAPEPPAAPATAAPEATPAPTPAPEK